ncbi:copper homeostasis protein CutC [Paracoccus aurantiacus]|uniref:PF03932 family protein CutC n=1 Tax=Paracoccus aurantiacus TaxID=2599412 RepID=A0A5C6S4A9_9RHOB|nr:copper homeostasis protein CutC [Paracoccus aurantiacus]TXB69289.1 copper homeostasis protein CutC [Paracoccus aurantiacus]
MNRITLEICVDDADGIRAAEDGGADRIELCAALGLGGLTPSAGLVALAARSRLPVMAMIRPRAGAFVWSADECGAMLAEIDAMRDAGLAGVVIGASLPDGRLDAATLARLMRAAEGMEVTLHRAIDLAPNPAEAMQVVAGLGIRRVLSSGGAPNALAGLDRLAAMQTAAPNVAIMPGGGVSAENAAQIAAHLPDLQELHASASVAADRPALDKVESFGFLPPGARRTDAGRVAALRAALDQIALSRPPG